MYKYAESKLGITKDGHTMFDSDIVKDLNRKSHLEALTVEQQQEIALQNAQLLDAGNEITELKSELEQHDDQITNIEIANQEMLAVADARINKQVNENNELKAMVNNLINTANTMERANIGDRMQIVIDVNNMYPQQCLASVKADAVNEFANEACGKCTTLCEVWLSQKASAHVANLRNHK